MLPRAGKNMSSIIENTFRLSWVSFTVFGIFFGIISKVSWVELFVYLHVIVLRLDRIDWILPMYTFYLSSTHTIGTARFLPPIRWYAIHNPIE